MTATIADIRRYEYLLSYKFYCGDDECDGQPHVRFPHAHARAKQRPPRSDFDVWALISGRGFGKTRTGAEFTKNRILNFKGPAKANRAMIIAPTLAVGRDVCINGESGMIACMPADMLKGGFNQQTQELRFTNGGIVKLFGADDLEDADRIRGYQGHTAWFEELATQRYQLIAWDNAAFANRLGDNPKTVVTATPRPTPLIRKLLKGGERTVITTGSTWDNAANLPDAFLRRLQENYVGTRLEAQELLGELVEDTVGALWTRDDIQTVRGVDLDDMVRVVVAIDPAGGHKQTGAQTGITVVGMDARHRCYVFEDASDWYEPEVWAKTAVDLYHQYGADAVVAELNFGMDMVVSQLRIADRSINVVGVNARKSKQLRAEPVASLYKRGDVVHVGTFAELEQQMCSWIPPGQFEMDKDGVPVSIPESKYSPDRIDSLAWAVHNLRNLSGPRVTKPRARFHGRA